MLQKDKSVTAQLFEILWGGAVADAIGNPLEFKTLVTNADFLKATNADWLAISDDTQMSLFAYEALIAKGTTSGAYLRWYQTQKLSKPPSGSQGLLAFKSLYRLEAPGSTCMGSCLSLSKGRPVLNDSKGNGTVMRVAPIAVMAYLTQMPDEEAYMLAKEDALETHKHPLAWQSSVFLTSLYLNIFRGAPLPTAILTAVKALPSCSEVGELVASMTSKKSYALLRSRRCGWVAEEALALAVGANLHCNSYMSVVRDACQGYSSDSDTVAGIAGSIAAALGHPAPDALKKKIAATDAIEYIIDLYATN